jgi:hypothetical protein
MSRGLGKLQHSIKRMIWAAEDYGAASGIRFADMRNAIVTRKGGAPSRDKLRPTHERSLKRAMKTLVDRGDVLIIGGNGRPGDPYRYVTVEAMASRYTNRKITDTAEAKKVCATFRNFGLAGGAQAYGILAGRAKYVVD